MLKISLFVLLLQTLLSCQNFIDIGVIGGYGAFSSNSPYVNGFTTSVSIGGGKAYNSITPRFSFYYAGDINKIFPEESRSYYPYMTAYALKGIYGIKINPDFYYEQGIGVFAASDHLFKSSSGWGGGFIFSFLGGADLRNGQSSGFRTGIGAEYGFTIFNRYITYMGVFLQMQYIISYE